MLATGPTISGTTLTGTTVINQNFELTGVISPAALGADQNDYNPANLATASVIRQDSGAANRNITGLSAQGSGTVIIFANIGANNIVLKDSSTSSAAANRFLLGTDVTLAPNQSAILWYDGTSSRWRCGGVFVSGGAAAGTVTSIGIGAGLSSTQTPLTTSGTISMAAGSFSVVGTSRNVKITQGSTTTLSVSFDEVVMETALGALPTKRRAAAIR